jgi:methyl-accepting chemotaxis protein
MNGRKILIVDKKFQYTFITKNLILLCFTFFLIFAVIGLWEKYQVNQGFLLRPPENAQIIAWAKANNVDMNSAEFMRQFILQAKVYTFFQLLWQPMAIVLIINALVLILANIYYSNTIVGPIYRLKALLERKIRGEKVEPLHFRKNDAFHELAELINKTLGLK